MDASDQQPERNHDTSENEAATECEAIVSCHETRPGRRVFTERGNADGWISSDHVVELGR